MNSIHGRTRLFCVLGHPVAHTLSPAMHNAALAALGEDAVYLAFDVPPTALPAALDGIRALRIAGANLTIPHKEQALSLLDHVSDEARLIGAVNTVGLRDGALAGENTDGRGFLAALAAAGFDPAGCRALILGAGGSARAVAVSLASRGASLTIANRTLPRAEALARLINERCGPEQARAIGLQSAALESALAAADLLVNTTSLGMSPTTGAMPPIPPAALRPGLFVYDLIYNPPETRLLAAARRAGCRTANGVSMLAHQGALALEFWLGRPAPAAVMERQVLAALSCLPAGEG